MDLFAAEIDENTNRLPQDGKVLYYGKILSASQADDYFTQLHRDIAWQNDQVLIQGKLIITQRKVAWYGDKPYDYTYSGATKRALRWNPILQELKTLIEQRTGELFNSCLLNLYDDGETGMAWHSDNERMLGKNTTIASFSLGAERKFCFKHKTMAQHAVSIELEHGSLLVMKDETQSYWLHSLPKTKRIHAPRINLTFRTIVNA